jgi:hypothetical protein
MEHARAGHCPARYYQVGLKDVIAAAAFRLGVRKPGTIVERMIKMAGFTPVAGCRCGQFKAWMNEIGWWGCFRNRQKIIDWFVEQASRAGVEFAHKDARGLLWTVLREIQKERAGKRNGAPASDSSA